MVKANLMFLPSRTVVLFLAAALVVGGVLSFFPSEEGPEKAPCILTESIVLPYQYAVRCLVFAPDGKTLVAGGGFRDVPGEIKVWDLATRSERALLRGKQNGVYALAFAPDGRTLAGTSFDQVVTLWDVARGRELASIPVPMADSLTTVLSGDGQTLALAGWDKDRRKMLLWRVASDLEGRFVAGSGPVTFSANGRRLALWRLAPASPSADAGCAEDPCTSPPSRPADLPVVQVQDLQIGREMLTLPGHQGLVWGLAFSPDGHLLASGGFDETVKVWEVATGQELLTLRGHTDQVGAVAFAPNGRLLASGSHDGTVKLWEVATGRELASLRGHTGTVTAVAFSPDGQCVASASHDRTVRLWCLASHRFSLAGTATRRRDCRREAARASFSPGTSSTAGDGVS